MKKKKIGIILNHVSLRSDIRLFIEELSLTEDIVIYGSENEIELLNNLKVTARVVNTKEQNKWARINNKILRQVYYFFGKIPKTKTEYKNLIRSGIYKEQSNKGVKKGLLKFKIKMLCPHLMSFDQYVKRLVPAQSFIEDIDCFISFTDILKEGLIAQIIKSKKPLFTYIHSWDHIPKFHRFSKKSIHYLTWNSSIKQDLMEIHDIPEEKISTLAASQFYFIKDYKDKKETVSIVKKQDFIYFPCSFGYPKITAQEIEIIKLVADELLDINPDIKLMVRAYPMLSDWNLYDQLKLKKNIVFDDYERSKKLLLNKDQHLYKCNLMESALAILHVGTTIGLEASYFDKPVIYLNIKDIDYGVKLKDPNHIFHAWDQYHLQKYYYLPRYPSVIEKKSELITVLNDLLSNNTIGLLPYNKQLQKYSALMDINEFTNHFLNVVKLI